MADIICNFLSIL